MAILQIVTKFRKQFRKIIPYRKSIISQISDSHHTPVFFCHFAHIVPFVLSPFFLSNGRLLLVMYCFSSDIHLWTRMMLA